MRSNWLPSWRMLGIQIKYTWLSWMTNRAFFFLLAFSWMMPLLVPLFVWMTAAGAANGKTLAGMSQGEIIAYYLIALPVNQITYSQTHWTVGDSMRDGRINFALLRPIAPIFSTLADELAGKAVFMLFVAPVTVLLAVILHPAIHITLLNVCFFIPILLFAWLLRFLWGYTIALHAFWAVNARALLSLDDSLLFLLAGQIAPIPFLPGAIQNIARILPYRYMIGFPSEVLVGQVSFTDLLTGLGCQLGWITVILLLAAVLWRRGVRHYTAVGG